MLSSVWVCVCAEQCVWRQCQSCDSNHEAGSDPARSLSGFASFSSQGIFGIVVSDTLIVMGRPGCQWSAWISILLGSASRALAMWCNRSLSCLECWLRGRCLLTHQVAYLWAGDESRGHLIFFFSPWAVLVKCPCNLSATAMLALYSHCGLKWATPLCIMGCQSTVTVNTFCKGNAFNGDLLNITVWPLSFLIPTKNV